MKSLTYLWIETDLIYLQSTGAWSWADLELTLGTLYGEISQSPRRIWLLADLSTGAPEMPSSTTAQARRLSRGLPANLARCYLSGLQLTLRDLTLVALLTQEITTEVHLVKRADDVFEMRRISSHQTRVSGKGNHPYLG